MSNRRRNSRKESKRTIKSAKTKQTPLHEIEEGEFISKNEKEQKFNKRYLILCEGETEEAYFSGLKNNILLKEKFRAVQIEIVAPSSKKRRKTSATLLDNSLKGMVWEAIQDGRNSYFLSEETLLRARKILSTIQSTQLTSYKNDFYLSDRHYMEFLQNKIGLNQQTAESILHLTDKQHFFEDYEHTDPKKQFYTGNTFTYGKSRKRKQLRKQNIPNEKDFDKNWKSWLLKAYSCRTFENWLILHFEACKTSFTISKETEITAINPLNPRNSIHHLWTFAPKYCKGFDRPKKGEINAYNILKPSPYNPKYETEIEAQAVIDKVNTAILNSFWLRKEMETELALQGGRYYEVNPYTNTDYLLASLLEKEILYGSLGDSIDFDDLSITIQINRATNEFQVTLINNSLDKRVLINNTNKDHFLKILTISDKHIFSKPVNISHTVNLPPNSLTPTTFSVRFTQLPINIKSYLIFQNIEQNSSLYFPL